MEGDTAIVFVRAPVFQLNVAADPLAVSVAVAPAHNVALLLLTLTVDTEVQPLNLHNSVEAIHSEPEYIHSVAGSPGQ